MAHDSVVTESPCTTQQPRAISGFTLDVHMRYARVGDQTYVYESAGGAFRAELTVDSEGMVAQYGNLWSAEVDTAQP